MTINYSKLEQGIKIIDANGFKDLVNFRINATQPVHRWYYFKEGFSTLLVKKLIEEFSIDGTHKIVDIFSGSATTVLTAQDLGIRAFGIDINPFFRLVGRTKLTNGYEMDKIKYYKNFVLDNTHDKFYFWHRADAEAIPELTSFKRCFNKETLSNILKLKGAINKIDEERYKRLFIFALTSIIDKVSKVKKDGKGLKFVDKKSMPVKDAFASKLNEIIFDIDYKHKNNLTKNLGEILNGDARNLHFPNNFFDLAIFSPPYLNSFDYTEVYKLELWLSDFVKSYEEFRNLSNSTLRSHLTSKFDNENLFENVILIKIIEVISKRKIWNKKIPSMIRSYFNDMKLVFEGLRKILKNDVHCVFVIGNSSYAKIPIPTDVLLARIAEEVGFSIKEIRVTRQVNTSSQQLSGYNKFRKYLRESIVILENNK